ncbi:hypothetical protein TruAng_011151 [Truncatella angustata]|nr:hypothetical protein TruAng_011151 [Truncatella angustata]
MSFGFGVGDFLAVIKLANEVRKDFAGAPDQFQQITAEIRNLAIVLQDVDIFLIEHDVTEAQKNNLRHIRESCRLESRNGSLGERAKRGWKRVKWEPDEVRDLRSRITSNITVLNSFTVSHTRDGVAKLVERKDQQEHRDILNWLTSVDIAAQQSDFIGRRQAGTGRWLIDSPEYAKWKATKGDALFCHGIPGAGKTILSSIVVDDLQETFCTDKDVAVCYFYCDFKRPDEQRPKNVILSFLKQLAQAAAALPECVKDLYNQCRAKRRPPSLEEATKTLRSVAGFFTRIFVVVDALDECRTSDGSQGELISELIELQRITSANILATSRPVPHIVEKFRDFVSLEIRASRGDIKKYVDGNGHKLPRFVSRSPELLDEIVDGIVEGVDGMFLLAKLHLNSLENKKSLRALRKTLTTLTKGSDVYTEAYQNTMERIRNQPKDQEEIAIQTLMWIVHARRPLTTIELQHALSVEVGELEFLEDNIPDLQDMVSACCGRYWGHHAKGSKDYKIVQEFLERTNQTQAASQPLFVDEIAWKYFGENPPSQVTALHLAAYFGLSATLVIMILENIRVDVEDSHCRTPLSYGSENGQEDTVQVLLENSAQADSLDTKYGWTPLLWATANGHEGVIRLLLTNGAQADNPGRYGRTPLSRVAAKGHEGIVQLLLENGAQADSLDTRYRRTPLSWAAENGHEGVIRLLLAQGAQADSPDGYRRTPLSWAAENGDESVIRLLLAQGAQADSPDGYGQTPLSWAAENGHESVIRLLLTNGAQADSLDTRYGRTPLLWAAINGHEVVIRLLLTQGARADSLDTRYGRTPLSWAAVNGHEGVVRLLLAQGAQADSPDNDDQTPLSWAAAKGHESVIRLLLTNGAQADSPDGYGRTPLSWAAAKGHESVIRLLLTNGAQADSPDRYGRTPLSWAAAKGHESVVRLLLTNGAQADSPDNDDRTPLSWAAANEHESIIRLLLTQGAQADSLDTRYGRTPLSWAAAKGHESVIRLLLTNGAQADSPDRYGRTPLSWAAAKGHESVIRLLLTQGAQADSLDTRYGRTPLSWAAENGHEAIVRTLLSHNADAQSSDHSHRTILFYAVLAGKSQIVRILTDLVTYIDIKDYYGSSLVSIAARLGYAAIIRQLTKVPGIDAVSVDQFGHTPMWWAYNQGHHLIMRDLEEFYEASGLKFSLDTPAVCNRLDFTLKSGHCECMTDRSAWK